MTKQELATARETLRANATLEMECYSQARMEMLDLKVDPITWIRRVAARAQEIKDEKKREL